MKGTFIFCAKCGKTKAWGNPERWRYPFRHFMEGCNGDLVVTLQATGCRSTRDLGTKFADVEAKGFRVRRIMMDLDDWLWMRNEKSIRKDGTLQVWGARLILNGYLIPRSEKPA